MADELTTIERSELEQLETVIERGLQTFYEVGQALLDIKTKGLYKEYGTFEDYCRQRWDIDRDTAYYLRQSVSIMDNISDPLHEQPLNLEQVKPLNKLKEPQEQREAWQMAVESAANGRITARHVEAAVQAIKQVEQGSQSRRILHSSESNEWYTPRQYIEAARELMGAIDLDPASSELANETIGAGYIYTIDDDGLTQSWYGRIFLNPPYGRDNGQEIWSGKLIEEYEAGRVKEAILLVNAVTDTKWFQRLWNYTICFTDHRISFSKPSGDQDRPTHGNAFVYFGTNTSGFIRAFSQFGAVVQRIG